MRFLARIAGSSRLWPCDLPELAGSHFLEVDGSLAVVKFHAGGVWLRRGDGRWDHFGLRKRSAGAARARWIYPRSFQ